MACEETINLQPDSGETTINLRADGETTLNLQDSDIQISGSSYTPVFINDYIDLDLTNGQFSITLENAQALNDIIRADTPLYMKADGYYNGLDIKSVAPVQATSVPSGSDYQVSLYADFNPDLASFYFNYQLTSSSANLNTQIIGDHNTFPQQLFSIAAGGGGTIPIDYIPEEYYMTLYGLNAVQPSSAERLWFLRLDGSGLPSVGWSYAVIDSLGLESGTATNFATVTLNGTIYKTKWKLTGNNLTISPLETTTLVPDTRTINGHPLDQDITLTAVDVGATLYQANWLFGSSTATQENFDALEFAIVNNVPVTARSGAGVTYLMTNVSANSAGLYISSGNVLTETVGDVTHEIARGNEWFIDRTTLEITYTSPTIDKQALEEAIAANSASITYTSSTIESRNVTHTTVTEPVQGTKPISSYGPFNYIPLDMSVYTSGAANKALLPEKHLPSGAYVVTVAGYMRLGTETKMLQPGHIVFWDTESGELDLLGYNACEYWGYDSQNETWDGGYFTTASDVEYMIEEKMPNWVKISNGMFIVATKDTGYYTFAYPSATGTSRRIRIDVEGTSEYYYPYNDTVLIKSETGVLMLGRYNLWFAYDDTNNYYKQPIDLTTIQSQLDALDARITALGG